MKEIIENLLNSVEIPFEVLDDSEQVYVCSFDEESQYGTIHGSVTVYHEDSMLVMRRAISNPVPENKIAEVTELISRINSSYVAAQFVLNYEDNLVSSDAYFFFTDNEEDNEQRFRDHYDIISGLAVKFYPVFLAVAYGDKDPVDVFNEIEHQTNPRLN